ncbi:MAG TPA: FG-GAP-like repeat-containing protein [Gemmatimonadales bacterium]|nr:FG-GAP-like repeat-containing protein [Gemmatimonadales bacterium]
MTRRCIPFVAALLLGACGKREQTTADAGAILTARTLGLAYIEENRLPEAEKQFVTLIRLVPEEPSGHANLGLVYLRMGRYEDAQRAIDRAVTLAPDDPDIRLLQATAQRLHDRPEDARRTLEASLKTSPAHLKTLYALAELDSANRERYLQRVVDAAPANVPARLAFAEALLGRGATTEARDQLELLRQRLPTLPSQAERFYAAAVTSVQANRGDDARLNLARATRFFETTPVYQAGMAELRSPAGAPPGYPVLTLNPRLALLQRDPQAVVKALRFADVTGSMKPPAVHAATGDYDNDGHLDYFDRGALFHNNGDDTFRRATVIDVPDARAAVFADFDHDGDLDLFVGAPSGDRYYRNNGDGTFREMAAVVGLSGAGAVAAAFGDFDNDGRIDLAVARPSGVTVYRGLEEGRFDTLATLPASPVVAAADYDNDGFLDLYAGAFYHNDGTGNLVRDTRADVPRADVRAAAFFDFDNDGWLDLIVSTGSRLVLLHNDEKGRFLDRSALLPPAVASHGARQIIPLDVDDDGDLDLIIVGLDGSVHVLRNDGGNANQFVTVALVALRDGSGKNNSFGIGSRLELRAKDLYQMRTVDQPVMHFGLGNRLKADVLRVTWTNGVPQSYYYPGGSAAGEDRNVMEQQVLKGSCTFLYTWDGEAYRFLTDVTWASALGMPLGIMAGEKTVYGPPQAAREYFRVPGDRLRAVNGRYRMQLTEELWEVAYVDQLELLAVDHPDTIDVYVDERFVPPGTPGSGQLTIRQVREQRVPIAATDERGRDLLKQISAKDDDYVGGFSPGRYQGITAMHDLVLDFGPLPEAPARLVLEGWLFLTDASINAAVAQSHAVHIVRPVVQVRDAAGSWRTVASLTFPAGKDKSIIVDMTGKWRSHDRRVRIRTNMEIYWDDAFLALGAESAPVTVTRLAPVAADLHARGWSRVYRKGGRYGPFWFDYAHVTTESPWRPVRGHFTRYGDVLPLLGAADDQAVIIASGDEMTVEFPEAGAPPLPAGWQRDFLLYNVAWMKDADLHTAAGQTVEPLPFHAAERYPYAPGQTYPDDAAHRRYVAEYNTRSVAP